jgi:hypothetical protein
MCAPVRALDVETMGEIVVANTVQLFDLAGFETRP